MFLFVNLYSMFLLVTYFQGQFFLNQYVSSLLGLVSRQVHNSREVKICQDPYNETQIMPFEILVISKFCVNI